MRRFTALALAALIVLSASCGRAPTAAEITDADANLSVTDDVLTAATEETQTVAETQTQTEPETQTVTGTAQPSATTTQPPVPTTNPPEPTAPPENGSASFTARRVRFYREYTPGFESTAAVADSRSALDGLPDAFKGDGNPNALRADDFAAYTDEWFVTHRLIVICVQESSGSIRHDVRSVDYTQNGATVKIERTCPQVQTCDIAHWLILIELPDTRLHGGDAVELIWNWTY